MATEHTGGNVSKHPPAEVNEWCDFSQEPHRTAESSTEKSLNPQLEAVLKRLRTS